MVMNSKGNLIENSRYNYQPRDFIDRFNTADDLKNHPGYSRVEFIPLRENLKVRGITKGSAEFFHPSQSFQKDLLKYIQKYEAFSLTASPLDDSSLLFHNLLKKESDLGIKGFDQWVSGDYKAATDKLNITLTKLTFEQCLKYFNVEEKYSQLLRSVLYEQTVTYPPEYTQALIDSTELVGKVFKAKYSQRTCPVTGKLIPATKKDIALSKSLSVIQENGQLMGSTQSFPVLCIINYLCYWGALEEYLERTINPKDLPCLVNGDDILFRTDKHLYQVWLKWIKRAGFVLSVGKNYVHSSLFTINSSLYYYRFHEGHHLFQAIPYYNCGLLFDMSKGSQFKDPTPIWDKFNKFIQGAGAKRNNELSVTNKGKLSKFKYKLACATYIKYNKKKVQL